MGMVLQKLKPHSFYLQETCGKLWVFPNKSLHFEKDTTNIKTKLEHSRIGASFLVGLKVHFTVERKTAFPIDDLDTSKLSLFDEDLSLSAHKRDRGIRWIARKRRRRGPGLSPGEAVTVVRRV
nr:uncharacterized protein LOC109191297 [Ipomoea trifida]